MAGQIEGFAGCNTYNGSYTATPNPDGTYGVTMTGLFTTGMACPPEIMLQEQYYLVMLQGVYLAQFDGNMMYLYFPAGTGPDGQSYPEGSLVFYQTGTAPTMP
jgi:heat shock protein HslJ